MGYASDGKPRGRSRREKACAVAASMALVIATVPVAALAASGSSQGGTPPSMPSGSQGGSQQGGTPPDAQGAQGGPGGSGGGGGANTMTFDFSGTYKGALSADGTEVVSSDESYEASDSDENAALVQNGGTLAVTGDSFEKSGDDTNGDNCNFYGLNSIFLAVGEGSQAYVSSSKLNATSEGSNGIFATDSGTVYAYDDTITTSAGNSRGLDATYDGTIVADSIDISTQGDHCASIATDRGGGNISATNSTLATAGSGSPLLYSTGDIEVGNCTGTATGSQIAGMEGLNTILVYGSTLASTAAGKTASDPVADGIIIYQSTSGDAESTTGEAARFEAVDSTLSSAIASGAMFYMTNTTADVVLQDTALDFDSSAAGLVLVQGNDSNNWGTAGSNGATVNFTGINEVLSGDISADTISALHFYLLDSSSWKGAASVADNSAGATNEEHLCVYISSDSTWTVTADSTVDALYIEDGGQVVDAAGNPVTIVSGDETIQSGSSDITVTVNGTHGDSFDTSSSNELVGAAVDRTGFDAHFGTNTSFASASTSAGAAAQASSASSATSQATSTAGSSSTASSGSAAPAAESHWYDFFVNIWNGIVGFFTGK